MSATITDTDAAEIERLANCAIHEIVFANHHAQDDEIEEAQDCLIIAQSNLTSIADLLTRKEVKV
jgi:hypothetical protein